MSNYSIQASPGWDTRDGLTTGATGKTISATEFHDEFTEIATVIATKANLASPELTGIPKATTASAGTNTDQIATTQYVVTALAGEETTAAILLQVYPVNSIYTTVSATDPGTLFGGTWVSFGAGKVLIGIDTSGTPDTDFDTVEETGGRKDAVLPAHTHDNIANPLDNDTGRDGDSGSASTGLEEFDKYGAITGSTGVVLTGNENLQPYIVVYMWKRTA